MVTNLSSPVPVGCRVGSPFGPRGESFHAGQDYPPPVSGQQGVPIFSMGDGRLTDQGWGADVLPDHSGNIVLVDHGGGFISNYGHLASFTRSIGDTIRGGEQIGVMGWTGNVSPPSANGTHLHLGLRVNGSFIDPQAWLNARGIFPGTTPPLTPDGGGLGSLGGDSMFTIQNAVPGDKQNGSWWVCIPQGNGKPRATVLFGEVPEGAPHLRVTNANTWRGIQGSITWA